ncbi:MAG TPA: class I SAM-dependent methyltransferase [Caldisericia bacterium]|nr:class I SAM-dependent methyltransferase [Caldisericia bacterium]HPF49272.1 class I SAM-dependent methyltransferase [Caldisericia bacterium]HPI84048.1 class I SAM-dependent methyltransferase [Caldisericia bacterium]HPQ93306.1 class I SAM-dependent methyltransferase [Caldisericia bacterium]HRV75312.1 class I SAM-dependent methyltransferase [Caldisericia bacterium]
MSIYNDLGSKYDLYIDWDRRLSAEIPFLRKLLARNQAKKVLDVGCATGRHAIELKKLGFEVFGMDESDRLIKAAKQNALKEKEYVTFNQLSMLDIAKHPAKPFDSVMMLGNIISLLDDQKQALDFFKDAKEVLKIGGTLIVQTINYRLMNQTQKQFELINTSDENTLFVKVFNLDKDSSRLSVLMLEKEGDLWNMTESTNEIMAFRKEDLVRFASRSKYGSISMYGKLDGSPFKPESSEQLIAVFQK